MLGESWELMPSEMEEHAGRRHKGPEAAAQTGGGEAKERHVPRSPAGFPKSHGN